MGFCVNAFCSMTLRGHIWDISVHGQRALYDHYGGVKRRQQIPFSSPIHSPTSLKCGPLSTRNKSVRFCRCEGLFTKMKGSSFQIDSGNYIKITVHLSPCPVPSPIHIPNVLCCRTNNISCQRPWGHRRTKQINKTNYN